MYRNVEVKKLGREAIMSETIFGVVRIVQYEFSERTGNPYENVKQKGVALRWIVNKPSH